MLFRIAVAMAFVAAILIFATPVSAAPAAQTTLPDFTLNAQSTLTVTLVLTDGETVVVPVAMEFVAENQDDTVDVSIDAQADTPLDAEGEELPDLEISVESSAASTATIEISAEPTVTDTEALTDTETITDTETLTDTEALTNTEGLTDTEALTGTETTTATTETGEAASFTVNSEANIRSGPGTDFEIVRVAQAGEEVIAVGQNEDGTWLQLEDGNWIATFLVDPTDTGSAPENGTEETCTNESSANESSAEETPTPTPEESDTVTPTVEVGAVGNQAASAVYLLEIEAINTYMADALTTLEDLLQNPQPANVQWRLQVAAQIAVIQGAHDEFLAITPVAGYEELHDQVVAMATTCQEAANEVDDGIANVSASDLRLAAESILACASESAEVATTIQTLQ